MRIPGVPLVQPGDDLAALISAALRAGGVKPLAGDLIAVAQKIVSKAEGRSVRLDTVRPSAEAED
ncbi:MAG: coenzyme F420-0:L-glutamate ligase, partial [Gammaproteobacteria bacterium]|nr:coenzyme F420-0:L-glutamate ligase [Gammaproteobacteria bacterium]